MSKSNSLSFKEKLALLWFSIDAFTHLTIEAGYLWLALTTTAIKTDTWMGSVWRQYGRADARWEVFDPNVISLELLTVLLIGPLCLIQIYGVINRTSWRHMNQIVICVAEIYGGWMTFCPEWVDGNRNLNGSTFILLWIYLVFMNGLWVALPGLFLWESCGLYTDVSNINISISIDVYIGIILLYTTMI